MTKDYFLYLLKRNYVYYIYISKNVECKYVYLFSRVLALSLCSSSGCLHLDEVNKEGSYNNPQGKNVNRMQCYKDIIKTRQGRHELDGIESGQKKMKGSWIERSEKERKTQHTYNGPQGLTQGAKILRNLVCRSERRSCHSPAQIF